MHNVIVTMYLNCVQIESGRLIWDGGLEHRFNSNPLILIMLIFFLHTYIVRILLLMNCGVFRGVCLRLFLGL